MRQITNDTRDDWENICELVWLDKSRDDRHFHSMRKSESFKETLWKMNDTYSNDVFYYKRILLPVCSTWDWLLLYTQSVTKNRKGSRVTSCTYFSVLLRHRRPFEKLVLLLIRTALLAELNYICERPFVPDAVMVISPSTPLRSSSRTWNYELRKLLLPLSRAYSISDPASRNRQTAKSIAINQLTIARLIISHL